MARLCYDIIESTRLVRLINDMDKLIGGIESLTIFANILPDSHTEHSFEVCPHAISHCDRADLKGKRVVIFDDFGSKIGNEYASV